MLTSRAKIALVAFGALAMAPASYAQDTAEASATAKVANLPGYAYNPGSDRFTVFVSRARRFTTVPIDHAKLSEFCGDLDGCSVRIGMHNWDDTGRIASREFLFFYNTHNGNWRSAVGASDAAGSDKNNVVEHVNQSWSCYMTDGEYLNQASSENATGFGLLSWSQYNADCVLTVID
jgi:hypothetical protein